MDNQALNLSKANIDTAAMEAQLAMSMQNSLAMGNSKAAAATMAQIMGIPDSMLPMNFNSLLMAQQQHQQAAMPNFNFKPNQTKYQNLLSVIDEMGREMRTTYMGNKNSSEKLKRAIASARVLVKDCMVEFEKNAQNK